MNMSKVISTLFLLVATSLLAQGYLVGPEDVISVQVLGEKDFSGQFQIGRDGAIDFPYLNKISVDDLSTEQIKNVLTNQLKNGFLISPQVTVRVVEYNSKKVMVLGAVAKPGRYALTDDTRILDALSQAGGILTQGAKQIVLLRTQNEKKDDTNKPVADDANLSKVEQATPEEIKPEVLTDSQYLGTPMLIDYYGLINKGDLNQNVILKNGDVINVPKADEIFVMGSVMKSGPVPFEEKMTILQAITLAGGANPAASTRSTYILRKTNKGEEKIEVRLDKIILNKAKNVNLAPNDVIVVPESFF